MTLSSEAPADSVATRRVICKQFATQLAAERTRLLYQGSLLPTLFMFINGLLCAWLLWSPERYVLVGVWLGWLSALVSLRVLQVAAFRSASMDRRSQPIWNRMFLAGACVSGFTLSSAALVLMPAQSLSQQAWVFGLIGAATLSASVAYAVSIPAFLTFTLPCLLPPIFYLFWTGDPQCHGWGWLGLILLLALIVVAAQVNRLIERGLIRRFQNVALIEHLQQAQAKSDELNRELTRQYEERTRYLTHYDELTGLANRALFNERLREANQRARHGGRTLALLHINLDRFKLLNDSLGHDIADQLLRLVARRLNAHVADADTVARLSADEFAVLFDSHGNLTTMARITTRLLAKLRSPISVSGHELVVSASIGIALLPGSARDIAALVSQANMAMQHAKHLGGDNFQFYTESLEAGTPGRLQLEIQLRRAIAEGQLEVFYQPKLELESGRLNSAEALVRWRHPERGLISPGEFIGLAEETGLIANIGEFVLRKACHQACEWQREGLAPIRVSVNLSVHQMRQGKLVSLVRQVLEETGLKPEYLELELTESQLLESVEHIITTFQQLRALGVKLAIDDFGTGYSSLSYLKRFPVHCVKIDQAFIRGLNEGAEDAAITRAIIAMAHSLDLRVVAEGVEDCEQLEFLRAHGCDEVQGYLISRPVEASVMGGILRSCLAEAWSPVRKALHYKAT
ncbi:bifunctional diguanylate cyclase/phosphodiesterase [Pseudomonas sp. W2Oct36]|jgi:diguanylate cyclase (GGDEF)-like protein|uniref:cyclic-guanylate-specific phosphodiesterase n=2 Tax=Pseudomonas TaxID=286 RepID=A0A1C2E6J8_9PSED|nr:MULTISPECIES: bifunctional diguanylate cyclase/phosphodiesterase [Pseudomonas]MBD8596829.1 bifunctional diguanylate cyclase/phosphodiesterase [Pseudomonas sp. CFBP 8772]OCX22629.1 diguanylate cyclase [Pseudomonas graminis]RZI76645.1 MAG: bifunctional diguanylate cyclase/phosphodiesterase [Pseudomonas sp.]